MLIVCRLCLTASNDVIHIFREDGIRRKVSSILSKHFGSLFEVTEEHDEAICSSCWAHTDSFHAFYQSIKSAQNCYSSEDEEDGNSQPEDALLQQQQQQQQHHHPQHQQHQHNLHQQQNVKIIMYDSSTNEVIEERHEDSNDLQQQQHQHHHSHQQHEQQHQQHEHQQQYHPHVIVDSADNSVSAGYETFEVCEQTNDSSDLDLLMMIQPNEGTSTAATDDNGHGHHIVNVNEHGIVLDDDMDDPDGEQQLLQHHQQQQQQQLQHQHQQQTHGSMDNDPIMGSSGHRSTGDSGVISDFLHNNEHITVIEVSSPSQAQKLLQQQQQQQQQMQLQQQQQQLQPTRYPPTPPTMQPGSRIVQRTQMGVISSATSNTATTSIPPLTSSIQAHSTPGGVQFVRKRKLSATTTTTAAVAVASAGPSLPNVGTIVQRAARTPYIELSEPESPPDDCSSGTMQSPTFGGGGGGSGSGGAGEPYRMQCDLCSKTFKTFHRVQSHYRQKHNMNGYVVCCGDKFFEKDLLVDHILMHVNNRRQMKKISCEHCEQFFYRKRFYTRHLLKLHGIGAGAGASEPSSPVSAAATSATPINSAAITLAALNTSTASSTNSSIISHSSSNHLTYTSLTSPTVRQTQIIRRVAAPHNISSTTQLTTTTTSGATKMPMIVSIQSIAPKRIRMIPSTAAGGSAIIQATTATTASVANNGRGGAGTGTGPGGLSVKYEPTDGSDEVLILGN